MPEMDGIEAAQKIRKMGYQGVIVALTANALVGNDELFSQNGFDGFIPKPIDIRHLNALLNKFIRDKHRKKEKEKENAPRTDAPRSEVPRYEAAQNEQGKIPEPSMEALPEELPEIEALVEAPETNASIQVSGPAAEEADDSQLESLESVEGSTPTRHLFIINPTADKIAGNIKPVKDKITSFFANYPEIKYDIYVPQWCRDSIMYIQDYAAGVKDEIVRVHSIGGKGTLFEVINGAAELPNVEVAAHPYGKANAFLRYFGIQNMKYFSSMESQVFDEAIPMDIIRCGNNYGICYGKAGIEAYANELGEKWIDKGMPQDISFLLAGIYLILKDKAGQNYFVEIDGDKIEGDFASVMIANTPCYGVNMHPAVDAHPDDGVLDVYIFKNTSKLKLLTCVSSYIRGNYRSMPDLASHYRAKKIKVSSDETMCISIDGENFYGMSMEYEIMPKAVRFVCPGKIDLKKLPRIYNRPQEGLRGEL